MNTVFHAANRSATALLMAGLILGLGALPAPGAEKAKAGIDDDLQAAAPMIEQMQRHLGAAAEAVKRNDGKAAREAFAWADRVFALTRDFPCGADHGRARSPRMDLTEGEDAYLVRLDMPGLDKSDIDVKVEGMLLTITGSSESEAESRDAAGKTLRRERRSGRFQRTVTLPGPVQADKVDARYENGVLTITVPKAPDLPVDPRTIPIR